MDKMRHIEASNIKKKKKRLKAHASIYKIIKNKTKKYENNLKSCTKALIFTTVLQLCIG